MNEKINKVIELAITKFAPLTTNYKVLNRLFDTWLVNQGNQLLGSSTRESYYIGGYYGYLKEYSVTTEEQNDKLFLFGLVKLATSKKSFVNFSSFVESDKYWAQQILEFICEKLLTE